jgi:hypothetical protein
MPITSSSGSWGFRNRNIVALRSGSSSFLDHLTDLNAARVDHRDSALGKTAEPAGNRVFGDELPKASVGLANNRELGERVPKCERENLINAILGANRRDPPTEPSPDRDGVRQPFEDALESVDGLLRHLNWMAVLDAPLVREKVSNFRVQVEIVSVVAPVGCDPKMRSCCISLRLLLC